MVGTDITTLDLPSIKAHYSLTQDSDPAVVEANRQILHHAGVFSVLQENYILQWLTHAATTPSPAIDSNGNPYTGETIATILTDLEVVQ